ncbi:unnamed protein product [Phyllotreta striolata]|uniref:protein acetyllysine N-acetyltransferase n=1 Tax=Phyllotreta striolata TaxID=444603 RepID=A0A9N9TPX7_PHYSR|nr:unnamed protein product [Phyllotreta striolata]
MSCNYADGLSQYENKGVLGLPEKFDNEDKINEKCDILAEWLKNAKHVVVHTGAGISTAAGIPDFRGPNGVWTLEKLGKKPNISISFDKATPTKTHMALKKLIDEKVIHFIVSQNIDGLHLRSGVPRDSIAELHGNMFVAQCNTCNSQFIRSEATSTVGKKCLEENCKRSSMLRTRSCRGKLHDTILDWEDNLPENDLEISDYQSSLADLNICLGTTLQIVPSGNLPLRCKKYGGKLVIVNLQPTKHDKKADLIINAYVDDVMTKIMKKLGLEIPDYSSEIDPTKSRLDYALDWDMSKTDLNAVKTKYDALVKDHKKRKSEENLLTSMKKSAKIKPQKMEKVEPEETNKIVLESKDILLSKSEIADCKIEENSEEVEVKTE